MKDYCEVCTTELLPDVPADAPWPDNAGVKLSQNGCHVITICARCIRTINAAAAKLHQRANFPDGDDTA